MLFSTLLRVNKWLKHSTKLDLVYIKTDLPVLLKKKETTTTTRYKTNHPLQYMNPKMKNSNKKNEEKEEEVIEKNARKTIYFLYFILSCKIGRL